MAIGFMRCDKHGLVHHTAYYKCDVCTAENSGTQPTDVQQLKAEIAALEKELDAIPLYNPASKVITKAIVKMRQLSAI